jgi:hypothetical protein
VKSVIWENIPSYPLNYLVVLVMNLLNSFIRMYEVPRLLIHIMDTNIFIIFIDNFSKLTCLYLMKQKSEVLSFFQEFSNFIEN